MSVGANEGVHTEGTAHRPCPLLTRDAALLLALAAAAVVLLPRFFPVFFRMDDVHYMHWAATHGNPLAAFIPGGGVLFGVWRPVQNLAWWVLWRAFGLAPLGYQSVLTACLGLALVLYYAVSRELLGRTAAAAALVVHVAAFPYLYHVAFWFSDLTFVLAALLGNAALLLLLRAHGRWATATGLAVFAAAVLAKEPTAVVVPAVYVGATMWRWSLLETRRRRLALVTGLLLVAGGGLFVALNPLLHARQAAVMTAPAQQLVAAMAHRWALYAGWLMRGSAGTVLLVATCLAALDDVLARRFRRNAPRAALSLATGLVLGGLLHGHPSVALAVLVAALATLIVRRSPEAAAALWFLAPCAGLLTLDYTARTYLFEPSFGLALVVGSAAARVTRVLVPVAFRSRRRRSVAAILLVAAAGLTVAMAAPGAGARLRTLRLLSDSRQAFAEAVCVLAARAGPGASVVSIDYHDVGLDYVRDILPLPETDKARRQKTMESPELAVLLGLMGRGDLKVESATAFAARRGAREASVLVTSSEEDSFVRATVRTAVLVHDASRGAAVARIYRVRLSR